MHMRTSVDIPEAIMSRVRTELKARGLTFRDAVIFGLQATLLAPSPEDSKPFKLKDAAFTGPIGFAPGFSADNLADALRSDAEERMLAHPRYDEES
jgi:hypothetical protein